MNNSARYETKTLFAVLAMLFAVLLIWLMHNHYAPDSVQYSWVSVRALFDAESLRFENLGTGLLFGHILLLAPFYLLPWLLPYAPYILSIMATALLFVLWNGHMAHSGYSLRERVMLLALLLLNPVVLWYATSGDSGALSLLILYLLQIALMRVIYEGDIRSYISVGLLLALLIYFDLFSLYIIAVLLPLIVLFTPVRQLKNSPYSLLIIISLPLIVMGVSWLYFNWIFHDDPLIFLKNPSSVFVGARAHAEESSWLFSYGGSLVKPMLVALAYIALGYPALLYILWRLRRDGRHIRTTLIMMLYPAIAVGIASYSYFIANPLPVTALINAIMMAEIVRYRGVVERAPLLLIVLLLGGAGVNWYLLLHQDEPRLNGWRSALTAEQPPPHPGDTNLGLWLAQHRELTLIDIHSGYKVVALRGDALDLLHPYSEEYRLALRSERPDVEQIAVPNPDSSAGIQDEINRRFPTLYDEGMQGYRLVYDEGGWRVYRKAL